MIRKFVMIVLIAASSLSAATWAWSRAWEGALGGWELRVGSVSLEHSGYRYDMVLSIGEPPSLRRRRMRFGKFGGFGYRIERGFASVGVPFPFPVCLFAAYPCFVLVRTRLRRRVVLNRQLGGMCTQCGYDLTGLTEPRCPECSTAIESVTAPTRIARALRIRDAFFLFICLGIGYAVLSWVISLTFGVIASPYFGPADMASEFFGQIVGIIGFGAGIGIFWCSFGVLLLHRKPVRQVIVPLGLVAGATAFVAAALFVFIPVMGWIMLAMPTVSLLIACIILRRTAPDAAWLVDRQEVLIPSRREGA